jgi:hypothetical protein
MEKSKSERQIERMWFLENKSYASVQDILKYWYVENNNNIQTIADYYVQSYGSVQALLKKYHILKEVILID